MGGTSKTTQNTSQQSTSTQNPWDQAMPAVQGILGGINSQIGNYQPTAAEQGALGTLQSNAQGLQNYGGQATSLANDLMSGGGILNNAYQQYQNQLNPIANQSNDPMQAPGMQALLDTIRSDVSNSVNGQFAGAGRDLSGMNTQALARGISQGEAAPLLNQYNQNVQNQMGAAGALFGAGANTQQQVFGNQAMGLDTAINGIPLAQNNQANQILQAGQTARNAPLQSLGMLEGLTLPLAGLGGTTNTTGTGSMQGTQTMSPFQMAMMAMNALPNATKGLGQGAGILGSFF